MLAPEQFPRSEILVGLCSSKYTYLLPVSHLEVAEKRKNFNTVSTLLMIWNSCSKLENALLIKRLKMINRSGTQNLRSWRLFRHENHNKSWDKGYAVERKQLFLQNYENGDKTINLKRRPSIKSGHLAIFKSLGLQSNVSVELTYSSSIAMSQVWNLEWAHEIDDKCSFYFQYSTQNSRTWLILVASSFKQAT